MKAVEVLKQYWGYDAFRPLQEDIISNILAQRDTVALLPTGGGKSICYQVPAMMMPGLCLVISPLIALIKDQVDDLNKRGIPSMAIHSGMKFREIQGAISNAVYGKYKFIYVSPERLQSEYFRINLESLKVSMIAVDESHCISQWGHDFRPAYMKIADIRKILPEVPVLALTATATKRVLEEVKKKLEMRFPVVFRQSFERKNLAYMVLHEENKPQRLLRIFQRSGGSGLVYVRNRKRTEEIARFLKANSFSSDFYHAGLSHEDRDRKQSEWINGKTRIMVCTNAFGMGINKPDVRAVVHLGPPDCIENYFQEAGRAGRDGNKSYAVMLVEKSDELDLLAQVEQSYPPIKEIRHVYQALCNYYQIAVEANPERSFDFDLSKFCTHYNLKPITVFHANRFLEKENLISLSDEMNLPSRLMFTVSRQKLYEFQVFNPKADEVIKVLLRSYGGLFDGLTFIHESQIANRLRMPLDKLVAMLNNLQSNEIVEYYPQTRLPQLVFLQTRMDAKDIEISREVYQERKDLALERMKAMQRYISTNHVCRSVLLLHYFDDTDALNCGNCDVCIENRKSLPPVEKRKIIAATVMAYLAQHGSFSLMNAGELFAHLNKNELVATLNWMIETHQVDCSETNQLSLSLNLG
jgi:ATP-dependent DNA helicase RecQ